MFAAEGAFFAAVLAIFGGLYLASVRRERALVSKQDRFLAAATHELKTPLATISLLLESLRDGRVPEEKRQRYLSNGLLEAERLERGLHNVLIAAGLRSTGSQTARSAGDLADDVRSAVASMESRALAADIELGLDCPPSIPAVRDASAIELVVRNLIDNAIKFSPAGSRVHVALSQEGSHAQLRVYDQGRGLDAQELQHAFQPFWRGDDRASGGTGLGLHLVREMVAAHGGTVNAQSDGRGQGSTFAIHLPLDQKA